MEEGKEQRKKKKKKREEAEERKVGDKREKEDQKNSDRLFFRILDIGASSWDMEKWGCRGSPSWLRARRSEGGAETGCSTEKGPAPHPRQSGERLSSPAWP